MTRSGTLYDYVMKNMTLYEILLSVEVLLYHPKHFLTQNVKDSAHIYGVFSLMTAFALTASQGKIRTIDNVLRKRKKTIQFMSLLHEMSGIKPSRRLPEVAVPFDLINPKHQHIVSSRKKAQQLRHRWLREMIRLAKERQL